MLSGEWCIQIGDVTPDVDAETLRAVFDVTQELVKEGLLASGHDISDGGLVTCLCEMAFAGASQCLVQDTHAC